MTARGAAPGPADAIVAAGVAGLAARFAAGASTAVEAARCYLDRIERFNPALGAFVDLDADGALAAAAASDARRAAGRPLSPADGVPLGVKANIAVRGLPCTAGLASRRGRVADADAACVARLRAAGAVLLGSLNMDEAAFGAGGDNPWYGRTHNPHDLARSAGGSSAGSAAAVAAGLCAAALGTDTMGSVRIPAAYCGVVGVCPAPGRIDVRGVVPLSPSYDRVGLLARSLADAELLLGVLADPPGGAASGRPDDAAQIIVALEAGDGDLDAAAAAALAQARAAAATAGFALRPLPWPRHDADTAVTSMLEVVRAEAWAVHEAALRQWPDSFSPALRRLLERGAGSGAAALARARSDLADRRREIRERLAGCAALIAPVTPGPAPCFDGLAPRRQAAYTAPASFAGLAALSLPLAVPGQRLPGAVQVVAPDDAAAFAAARPLAAALPAPPPPGAYARGIDAFHARP